METSHFYIVYLVPFRLLVVTVWCCVMTERGDFVVLCHNPPHSQIKYWGSGVSDPDCSNSRLHTIFGSRHLSVSEDYGACALDTAGCTATSAVVDKPSDWNRLSRPSACSQQASSPFRLQPIGFLGHQIAANRLPRPSNCGMRFPASVLWNRPPNRHSLPTRTQPLWQLWKAGCGPPHSVSSIRPLPLTTF